MYETSSSPIVINSFGQVLETIENAKHKESLKVKISYMYLCRFVAYPCIYYYAVYNIYNIK